MRIEHVQTHQLLSVYLDRKYHDRDVLVIYIDDLLECNEKPAYANLLSEIAGILGGTLPAAFLMSGLCFIEMPEPAIRKILIDFNKAPFRLEQYRGGQCISENR